MKHICVASNCQLREACSLRCVLTSGASPCALSCCLINDQIILQNRIRSYIYLLLTSSLSKEKPISLHPLFGSCFFKRKYGWQCPKNDRSNVLIGRYAQELGTTFPYFTPEAATERKKTRDVGQYFRYRHGSGRLRPISFVCPSLPKHPSLPKQLSPPLRRSCYRG